MTCEDISVAPDAVDNDIARTRIGSRILTPKLLLFLASSMCSLTSFFLLLSVTPLYTAAHGGSSADAGLVTGVMMASTVVLELVCPTLLSRFGYRTIMVIAMLLLALPALLLIPFSTLPVILLVCVARGAGLAIMVVASTALAAHFSTPGRRGETLGLYGVAVSIPAVLGLPVGVWLSEVLGFTFVFVAAFVIAVMAVVAVPILPTRRENGAAGMSLMTVGRKPAIIRQACIFTATTIAAGVFITFLPLAVAGGAVAIAAVALLVQTSATAVFRWLAGWLSDRTGPRLLLIPAVGFAVLGTACVVMIDSPTMVIIGMGLFGIGYGIAQNVTLSIMFDQVNATEFNMVSAVWNIGFDGGMGIGAVGFGYLTIVSGFPWGFAAICLILLVALWPALFATRRDMAAVAPSDIASAPGPAVAHN